MATSLPSPGTSTQSTLSEWAGPYVTQMLGKARALSETPYQTYQGPMTAGPSALQQKYFSGLGSLGFPSLLGQSFAGPATSGFGGIGSPGLGSPGQPMTVDRGDEQARLQKMLQGSAQPGPGSAGPGAVPDPEGAWNQYAASAFFAPGTDMAKAKQAFIDRYMGGPSIPASTYDPSKLQPTSMTPYGGGQQPQSMAERYMNPYMQQVLAPQMQAMQRQADIQRNMLGAQAAKSGAFGGARAGLMGSQLASDLMRQQQQATGQAYGTAYDKAMQQFNVEQQQAQQLANMMAGAGATQRDIEQQGITADYNEFLQQRDYPMKQVQFLQSMLQGLPISTMSTTPAQMSGIGQLSSTVGALGNLMDLLKKAGISF